MKKNMETMIRGSSYWDNGKENRNYYLGVLYIVAEPGRGGL